MSSGGSGCSQRSFCDGRARKDCVEITPAEDHHSVEARAAEGASHVCSDVVIRVCTDKWTTLGT